MVGMNVSYTFPDSSERIRCKWVASLSDGSTVTEDSLTVPGEASAYQKLLDKMKTASIEMTGFRLQHDRKTHTAPSISSKAKFPSDIPFKLNHRRRATKDYPIALERDSIEEFFANYIVHVDGFDILLWIDEKSGDTWMQLKRVSK